MAKKYDVVVYDTDANGKPTQTRQQGVMASSRQELFGLFEMCGQKISIQREYEDEDSRNYGKQNLIDPNSVNMDIGCSNSELNASIGIGSGLMNLSDEDKKKIEEFEKMKANHSQNTSQSSGPTPINAVQRQKEPTRYFQIGGIKCKLENGKMYQKQWMRLSDEEATEFRIISDKNNKICPLKDKHIEVMKWVLTENDDVAETPSSENNDLQLLKG